MIDLIYCAGDNRRMMDIAVEAGFIPGCRSDKSCHIRVDFVDVEYKRPNWQHHLERVKLERPKYASVPDLSTEQVSSEDITRAITQAEALAAYCTIPLIVPKLPGQIAHLPEQIALGYSIPTSYGGALYPIWELEGRRVHLLGGSPHKQMELYRYLSAFCTVISADGNMSAKLAQRALKYWERGKWRMWPTRNEGDYYRCNQQSLRNIRAAWERLTRPE